MRPKPLISRAAAAQNHFQLLKLQMWGTRMLDARNGLNGAQEALYLPRARENLHSLVTCDDPNVCTESYTVVHYCYLTS